MFLSLPQSGGSKCQLIGYDENESKRYSCDGDPAPRHTVYWSGKTLQWLFQRTRFSVLFLYLIPKGFFSPLLGVCFCAGMCMKRRCFSMPYPGLMTAWGVGTSGITEETSCSCPAMYFRIKLLFWLVIAIESHLVHEEVLGSFSLCWALVLTGQAPTAASAVSPYQLLGKHLQLECVACSSDSPGLHFT